MATSTTIPSNLNLSIVPSGCGKVLEVVLLDRPVEGSTGGSIIAVKTQKYEVEHYSPGHIATGSWGRWGWIKPEVYDDIKLTEGVQVVVIAEPVVHPEEVYPHLSYTEDQVAPFLRVVEELPRDIAWGEWKIWWRYKFGGIAIMGGHPCYAGGANVELPVDILPMDLREKCHFPVDKYGRMGHIPIERLKGVWEALLTLTKS